ncbi:toprim domain-containing protein [Poseidonocella sp. HB161398]|uniref:toprim domain-containing protein n=1 Tax=Poseidonocella sp. HB161398 TaxID=2320855 RepID=UPI0035156206
MLGSAAGGAVRLTEGNGTLVVGEGIETVLAYLRLQENHFGTKNNGTRRAVGAPTSENRTWAALSTSGLRGLILPQSPGELIVAADPDRPGIEAAHDLAARATKLGWRAQVHAPPPAAGDWNDFLAGLAHKGLRS